MKTVPVTRTDSHIGADAGVRRGGTIENAAIPLAARLAVCCRRKQLFDYGRATSVEVLDAEADLLRARLEMITAHIDQRGARAKLEHAVGRDATR